MKKEEHFFEWKLDQKSLFWLSAILSAVSYGEEKVVVDFNDEAGELLKDLYIQTHKEN